MDRRSRQLAMLAGLVISAAVLTVSSPARNENRRAINPPGTKEGAPFSPGVLVGETLYISGQIGMLDGQMRAGGIVPETQAALDNIKKIVELGGMQMADVVSVNVYLADMADFAEMNNTYKSYFPEPRPARATVQVAGLVNHARIEISAIAVKRR